LKRIAIQARVCPQLTRNLDRFDSGLLPPRPLIADAMNRAMMDPTQGDDEFVADLPAEGTRLCKAQVVWIGMFSPANQTRLLGDEPQMFLVAMATRFGNRKHTLVDIPERIIFGCSRHNFLVGGRLGCGTFTDGRNAGRVGLRELRRVTRSRSNSVTAALCS
jgi:hypothetical protein